MKKIFLHIKNHISIFFSLFLLPLILTSCFYHVKLKPEGEYYVDHKNDIWYAVSSYSYEPVSVGTEYAEITSDGTILYRVGSASPKLYLTEEYVGVGTILYNRDYTLPTLSEFKADAAYVCRGETHTVCIAEIHEQDTIDSIVECITSSESVLTPFSSESSYSLKLASSSNPDIYYTLRYIIASDGTRYLQDRGEGKCVNAGNLLSDYLTSESNTNSELESASGIEITPSDIKD